MNDRKADPRAVQVAEQLLRATDADCVILFGSRARADWTESSDVDLMVLREIAPEETETLEMQRSASLLSLQTFGREIPVDVIPLTHGEFRRMGYHTINHVAARARREGIIVPRDTESYSSRYDNEDPDEEMEYQERERRTGDANMNYRSMHGLLDLGLEDKNTAFMAEQALENAMKAMISAMGEEYNPHHHIRALAADIRRTDREQGRDREWHFNSNLGQLENFAGATRYGPLITPIHDYREMANNITLDLDFIYERIGELTEENPWETPPEGESQGIEPRWRTSP